MLPSRLRPLPPPSQGGEHLAHPPAPLIDILMGSIDVRDPLSNQDLDASSPLSAPDLCLLIDRLQVCSLHIKEKVRSYVSPHHCDFTDIFSRCSCTAADSEAVADALSESLCILSDRPVDLGIRDLVGEIRTKRRELDERKDVLALLEMISSHLERLRDVSEDLRAGRLVEAMKAVNDLKVALLVEESGEEEQAVYRILRKEWSDLFEELQEVLARHEQSCVQFEPENNRMIVRGRSGDVEFRTTMEAMEILDLCNCKEDVRKRVHTVIDKYAERGLRSLVARQEVLERTKESVGGPWQFVSLLPLFDPPRHDSVETIHKALHLGVNMKMITGDQLAIAKETGRRLGMGTNMDPPPSLFGQHKDSSMASLPVDELFEKADRFAGVFPEHKYEM